MSEITVDTESCMVGWGPCSENPWAGHECRRKAGHGGRHYCRVCGVTKLPEDTEDDR